LIILIFVSQLPSSQLADEGGYSFTDLTLHSVEAKPTFHCKFA